MEIIIKPPLSDHWVIGKDEKGSEKGFCAIVFIVFIVYLEDIQIVTVLMVLRAFYFTVSIILNI